MSIRDSVSPTLKDRHIMILASSSHDKEPVISAETEEDLIKWKTALNEAICNVSAWKQACASVMKIENPSRKIFLQPQKLYDSVDVVLSPLGKLLRTHICIFFNYSNLHFCMATPEKNL